MSILGLDHVHVAEGISVPNFFNGRILSAEDLRMLLEGDRAHRRLLGRAIGPGVARGFQVAASGSQSVVVGSGVAINQLGETAYLPGEITLNISGAMAAPGTEQISAGVFFECSPPGETSGAQNAFVLTVQPDSTVEGSAPAKVFGTGESCGPGFVREGVRFRRRGFDQEQLATLLDTEIGPPTTARARNALAHLFLGSMAWRDFLDDPFHRSAVLEQAHDFVGIEDCEVPLATFFVVGTGIHGVDMWGVRRPTYGQTGIPGADPGEQQQHLATPWRQALGANALFQFQEQLAQLAGSTAIIRATQHFPFLPAAGLLHNDVLGSTASPTTFAAQSNIPFFIGLDYGALDRFVELEEVETILRQGTEMPAMHLPSGRGTPIMAGLVRTPPSMDRYAVFFGVGHQANERIVIDRLVDRVAELEAIVEGVKEDEQPVTVLYLPNNGTLPPIGGDPILGSNPSVGVGTQGWLRFRVLVAEPGEFQISLTKGSTGQTSGLDLLTGIHSVESEQLTDPFTTTVSSALNLLVRVTGYGKFLATGVRTITLTMTAQRVDDGNVFDSASTNVTVVGGTVI